MVLCCIRMLYRSSAYIHFVFGIKSFDWYSLIPLCLSLSTAGRPDRIYSLFYLIRCIPIGAPLASALFWYHAICENRIARSKEGRSTSVCAMRRGEETRKKTQRKLENYSIDIVSNAMLLCVNWILCRPASNVATHHIVDERQQTHAPSGCHLNCVASDRASIHQGTHTHDTPASALDRYGAQINRILYLLSIGEWYLRNSHWMHKSFDNNNSNKCISGCARCAIGI